MLKRIEIYFVVGVVVLFALFLLSFIFKAVATFVTAFLAFIGVITIMNKFRNLFSKGKRD